MKEDEPYILHILDAVAWIEKYTKGYTKERFLKDEPVREGCIRKLEIIGEAVKQLSHKFKEENSVVPWSRIAGMRDKLIHNYAGVDYGIVWKVIEDDLPYLQEKLKERKNK